MTLDSKRRRHGDLELLEDLNRLQRKSKFVLKSAVIGGALPPLYLISQVFHGGIWQFMTLLSGWFRFNIVSNLVSTSARQQAAAEEWLKAWDGSSMTRIMILSCWIASTALAGTAAYYFMRWRGRSGEDGQGIREGEYRLLSPIELKKEIDKAVKDPRNNHAYTAHDIRFSDSEVRVTSKTLSKNIGYAGGAGSGKSNAINEKLVQIRCAGDKAFIIDVDGGYYARFGRPGDVILSLMDSRTSKWDPWSEGLDENYLAAGLVEVRENTDARDAFFQGNGLTLLAALFRQTRSLPELWLHSMRSLDEVRAFLHDTADPAKSVLGKGGKDQDSAIFNIAVRGLRMFLPYLNHHPNERERLSGRVEETFSIRKWVKDDEDRRWVFLAATDGDWKATKPLFQLQTHIASSAIFERPLDTDVIVWIVIDEASSVGYIPGVPLLLDKARKYSGRLALGFQTFAQMQGIYGETAASNIMGGLQNMIVFNIKDGELAKRYSAFFTSREVELGRTSENLSDRGGPSVSKEIRERVLVTPSQFQALPERTAYVRFADFPPTKLYWSHRNYRDVNDLSNVHSKKPAMPWLGAMPVSRYRSTRERERELFLNDMKQAANEFLDAFADQKDPGREAKLFRAFEHCKAVLAGAMSVKETIDGDEYEITHVPPQLAVARLPHKVTYMFVEEDSGDETAEESAPEGMTAEEPVAAELDDGFS